jgi:UrcA family protein
MNRESSSRMPGRARARFASVAGFMCVIAMTASGAAWAAEAAPDGVPSLTVHYDDLDLTTEQGARTLYARITAAAEAVCPTGDMGNLSLYMKIRACRKQAIAKAVQRVGSPMLAAVSSRHPQRG